MHRQCRLLRQHSPLITPPVNVLSLGHKSCSFMGLAFALPLNTGTGSLIDVVDLGTSGRVDTSAGPCQTGEPSLREGSLR